MVENKIVLITGAAQGIGYQIGERFAEDGATVVLTDLNEDGVKKAADKLKTKGYEALGIKADVTNESDIEQMIAQTVETYGRLDVLINNAGMQFVSPLEEFPTEKFELLTKIMLVAPFVATKHAFPIMKSKNSAAF